MRYLEYVLAGKEVSGLAGPFAPYDPLLVNQNERPSCHLPVGFFGMRLQTSITRNDLQVRIAEEWERALERIRKGLLRKGIVSTDGEDLNVQILKSLIIGPPGR